MKVSPIFVMIGLCLSLATPALAKPEYLDVLVTTYPAYGKALSAHGCANCHVSDTDFARNPYGKQVGQQLRSAGSKTLTPDILHAVENQASNPGDISNLEKIKQGLAPGDPRAGSVGASAANVTAIPASAHAAAPVKKSLLPENAFHPAIVHFPIALFLAALLLDLIGIVRNNPKFLVAGWYNLMMAAISSFGAIATGLMAVWTMRLPLKGLILNHIVLAVMATVLMWVLVALRAHRHEKMSQNLRIVYFVVAVAGMLLISYSAHLGGAFVYGE